MKTTTNKAAARLVNETWSIKSFEALLPLVRSMATTNEALVIDIDESDLPESTVGIETRGSVGIVTVSGPMVQDADWYERLLGYVDYQDIIAAVQALANSGALAVVLRMNTPGGSTVGGEDVARAIEGINVPVIAHIYGLGCSAGYKIASACSAIWATHSAVIGSIGTITSWLDWSEYLAEMGINPVVIASGPYKDAGHPWKKPTEAHMEEARSMVEMHAERFKSFVSARRDVPAEAMQGQVFIGENAIDVGLIDGVQTLEEVIEPWQM